MPVSFQDFIIYLIVALTLVFLLRRWWRCVGKKDSCGSDCACGKKPIQRNPLIERWLRK